MGHPTSDEEPNSFVPFAPYSSPDPDPPLVGAEEGIPLALLVGLNEVDIKAYLDTAIRDWRDTRDHRSGKDHLDAHTASCYVDAFQSMRMSLFGELLPVEETSNLVNHARRELELLGEEQETIDGYLDMIRIFSKMGHSGGSASVFIPTLNDLLQFKNLMPLNNLPGFWNEVGHGMWQSSRNPTAFSEDGGETWYFLDEKPVNGERVMHRTETEVHTFCGPTEDEMFCACGCGGDDTRCPLYLKHLHQKTHLPDSHTCCRIPGRE